MNHYSFKLSTEGKYEGNDPIIVLVPKDVWHLWREYCFESEWKDDRIYGFDFSECDELGIIGTYHMSELHDWMMGVDVSKRFYESRK